VSEPSRIALAYDAIAAAYDRHMRGDEWMRRALWRHFDRLFRAPDHLLDVGCGTGIDTVHLASRGIRVTAVDVSPGMQEQLRVKLEQASLTSRVEILTGDIVDVLRQLSGPFDGIVSSFAALNTVPLSSFALEAARLLRPGGRLVAHFLGPRYRGGRKRLHRWRGLAAPETIDIAIQGRRVAHQLLSERDLYRRYFAADFSRETAYSMGLLLGERAGTRLPVRVLDAIARLEAKLLRAPALTSVGRFYVLDLAKRGGRS
jgi:ubiquinone/menaquinone biosynthesis C-methylase UbiE